MERTRLGHNDLPAGDPGYMIAIEVDHPFAELPAERRTDLVHSVDTQSAHVDESAFGYTRVVFHLEHCGWRDAGLLALRTERVVGRSWPTVGIEICQADLWETAPFFDHEPDGLGDLPEWCRRSDPRRHSTVIVEVEPEGVSHTIRRDSDLTRVEHDRRDARSSWSSTGRPQIIVEKRLGANSAAMSTAKPAFAIGKHRLITRIRSVRSDIYRVEVSHRVMTDTLVTAPRIPE